MWTICLPTARCRMSEIFYMDIDLYQYYLGRDDQSVNEQMLKKRIDQQMKVTRMVIAGADLTKIKEKEPKLASYMYRNISIMMAISSEMRKHWKSERICGERSKHPIRNCTIN